MLKVKKLDPRATLPTVAHPGEDIAYDLFALEEVVLRPGIVAKVRTGIAVEARIPHFNYTIIGADPEATRWREPKFYEPAGLLIRDRSSMAVQGIRVSGGVIDAGYRGEIVVMLTSTVSVVPEAAAWTDKLTGKAVLTVSSPEQQLYLVKPGAKIAQMIPVPVNTWQVVEVDELSEGKRGTRGFGSSGR